MPAQVSEEIVIAAGPDELWPLVTEARHFRAWYAFGGAEIDLRPGGKWSTRAIGVDGSESTVGGEYLEVDPPRRLVYTWKPSLDNFEETTVRYDLVPIATGTRLLVTHTGFADRAAQAEGTGDGWKRVLDWLSEFIGI